MRKKTLHQLLVKAIAGAHTMGENEPCTEIISVVAVSDFPQVQRQFDRQRVTIDTQRAEIALLRMLLRQALAQLERLHLTNKTIAPDFNRLAKRANDVLDRTTLTKDETDE